MLQVTQAGFGDLVDPHATIGGRRNRPLGPDEFCFEQPLQGRIQRTLLDLEEVVGALLDVLNEGISVGSLAAEGFENHHLERTRKQIARWFFCVSDKALLRHA